MVDVSTPPHLPPPPKRVPAITPTLRTRPQRPVEQTASSSPRLLHLLPSRVGGRAPTRTVSPPTTRQSRPHHGFLRVSVGCDIDTPTLARKDAVQGAAAVGKKRYRQIPVGMLQRHRIAGGEMDCSLVKSDSPTAGMNHAVRAPTRSGPDGVGHCRAPETAPTASSRRSPREGRLPPFWP